MSASLRLSAAGVSPARPALRPLATRRLAAPTVPAAAKSDDPAPPSSSAKGFTSATTSTTSKVPKKAPPPAKAANKKPRSSGRGALKRTEQGIRLGVGTPTPDPTTPAGPGEWVRLAKLSEWREGKAGKAVTLPDKTVLCLFTARPPGAPASAPPRVYATEIYSSAFKYPLIDAEVDLASGAPIVTVPFDGTTYNLLDGSVVAWCPRNTPVRALLGAVKSRVDPTPIRVFPARVAGDGQGVDVWFAR
jgi:hypothetical protein